MAFCMHRPWKLKRKHYTKKTQASYLLDSRTNCFSSLENGMQLGDLDIKCLSTSERGGRCLKWKTWSFPGQGATCTAAHQRKALMMLKVVVLMTDMPPLHHGKPDLYKQHGRHTTLEGPVRQTWCTGHRWSTCHE